MNGFDVASVKRKKPKLTRPSTPRTRAANDAGSLRDASATATVQQPRIQLHSTRDPSCAPHSADTRYKVGSAELEFCATYATEKSKFTNDAARQPIATVTIANCPATAGATAACQRSRPSAGPAIPKKHCNAESSSARIKAK